MADRWPLSARAMVNDLQKYVFVKYSICQFPAAQSHSHGRSAKISPISFGTGPILVENCPLMAQKSVKIEGFSKVGFTALPASEALSQSGAQIYLARSR